MDRPETVEALAEAGSRIGTADNVVEAAVVLSDGEPSGGPSGGESVALYRMFEALSLGPDGAVLGGGLLLEVNEEVTLELRLPDRSVLRTHARVVEILHGARPAMRVVWTEDGEP